MAAAPHAGDGGEEDEGVEFLAGEERVEVQGAGSLGGQHIGAGARRHGLQRLHVVHARRVDDCVHRVLGEQRGERLTVGDVARGDGDTDTRRLQLCDETRRARRVGAAAAGEHQVFGTGTGEPAGDVPAQRTRTAGDQHGAARRPPLGGPGVPAGGGVGQPATEHAAVADRDLVLGRLGEHRGQSAGDPVVNRVREVDQTAPARRVLQRRHPAQTPDGVLGGARHRVRPAGGHGGPGQRPQRGVDARVAQGLDEREGQHGADGQSRVSGVVPLVDAEQGDHTVERALPDGLAELPQQCAAVGGRVDRHPDQPGPTGGEPVGDGGGPLEGLEGLGVLGDQEQPVAPQFVRPEAAERLPARAVGPAFHGGLPALLPAPRGQPGQHRVQLLDGQFEGGGEGLGVLALHGLPEPGLHGVGPRGGRGRGGLQPVPLVLEGVGGQVGAPGAAAGEERPPVDGDAVHVELRESAGDRLGLGAAGPGGCNGDRAVQAALGHGTQHRAGAGLHERGHAQLAQGPDAVGEADGLADVPDPIVRRVRVDELTGEVRDDRCPGRLEAQTADDAGEVLQHGVHERRVERVAHGEPGNLAALPGEEVRDGGYGVLGSGDHDGLRAVDRRDAGVVGEVRQHLVLGGLDGDHRPAGGQGLHQRGTSRHQCGRVLQRQGPGHVCGRDLAHGVPGQVVRPHAPRLQQAVDGDLVREQRGLREGGAVQLLAVLVTILAEGHVPQWPVEVPVEVCTHLVVRLREDRERLVQLPPHADALRALPGEQESDLAGVGAAEDGAGSGRPRGQGPQALGDPAVVGTDHGGAVLQGGPGGGQREADVGEGRFGAVGGEGQQALGLGAQCGLGLAGQDPRHGRRGDLDRCDGGRFGHRGLLDDRVGVGAADAEGRDRGAARAVRIRPADGLRQQPHRARRPVHVRRRLISVQRPRKDAVAHRHHHLDHTGHAGRRLGVTDVGLQRAQPQRPVLRALLPVGGEERLRLDRVTQSGARAVRLHRVDVGLGEPGGGQGLPDDPLLRRAVRGGQTVGRAVLVDRTAPHDREDLVAVAHGVAEALHEHHAHALRPPGAVGAGAERFAPSVRGQPALAAELHERSRYGHDVHTAGDGHRALAVAQRLDGQVQGDQRRRARRVDGDGRALQSERVGYAPGDDARGAAGEQVALDAFRDLREARAVALVGHADEHAGAAALQGGRVDARPLERFPRGLQQ
ncbi:hypothetical protein Save01_06444 [Streptomyces avermitilis]